MPHFLSTLEPCTALVDIEAIAIYHMAMELSPPHTRL